MRHLHDRRGGVGEQPASYDPSLPEPIRSQDPDGVSDVTDPRGPDGPSPDGGGCPLRRVGGGGRRPRAGGLDHPPHLRPAGRHRGLGHSGHRGDGFERGCGWPIPGHPIAPSGRPTAPLGRAGALPAPLKPTSREPRRRGSWPSRGARLLFTADGSSATTTPQAVTAGARVPRARAGGGLALGRRGDRGGPTAKGDGGRLGEVFLQEGGCSADVAAPPRSPRRPLRPGVHLPHHRPAHGHSTFATWS